jgi:SAM-dependent methyltransferase
MWTRLKRGAAKIFRPREASSSAKGEREDEFEKFKRDRPGSTFAQFYAAQAAQTIAKGKAHSTLGLRLYDKRDGKKSEGDFFEAGRFAFERYRKLSKIKPDDRVVDYGCGSLRLGIHFLDYLNPENYFGLDVTRDFIDIGISAAPERIARKKPQLYAINAASIVSASEFGADLVISNAVSYHVHPDENEQYLGNLAAICAKPGARLIFDAKCSAAPVQFRKRSWAYPLEFYVDRLSPLAFTAQHKTTAVADSGSAAIPLEYTILEFRRG